MSDLAGVSIVYVNNFAGPHMGGGEVHLMHLVPGALAAGMRVTVVAMPGSGTAEAARAAGASVVEDDLMRGAPFGAAARLTGFLRAAEARIVHGTGFYTDVLARVAGHRVGAYVVDQVHCEPGAPLAASSGLRASVGQLVRAMADAASRSRADAVIADSHALADAVVRAGVDPARVTVAHNGIDPVALERDASSGQRPQMPRGGRLVGTLGRLEPVKGLDVLLDAIGALASSVPDVRFAIAGEGPERASLEARISAEPVLAERVQLLGFVPNAGAFLASLDAYCLPSRSEGFNTTVLEAMALGVPVVATDVGGTGEAIVDGRTGRLLPAGDPARLAAALIETLQDEAGACRMAAAARELVMRDFTSARMVETILGVYGRAPDGPSR